MQLRVGLPILPLYIWKISMYSISKITIPVPTSSGPLGCLWKEKANVGWLDHRRITDSLSSTPSLGSLVCREAWACNWLGSARWFLEDRTLLMVGLQCVPHRYGLGSGTAISIWAHFHDTYRTNPYIFISIKLFRSIWKIVLMYQRIYHPPFMLTFFHPS